MNEKTKTNKTEGSGGVAAAAFGHPDEKETQEAANPSAESSAGTVRSVSSRSSEVQDDEPRTKTARQIIDEATQAARDTGEYIKEAFNAKARSLARILGHDRR